MITVITGPPTAGKTTYIQRHAQLGDVVVDMDALAVALGSTHTHNHPPHIRAVAIAARKAAVETVVKLGARAWVIDTAPSEAKRRWYYSVGARIVDLHVM